MEHTKCQQSSAMRIGDSVQREQPSLQHRYQRSNPGAAAALSQSTACGGASAARAAATTASCSSWPDGIAQRKGAGWRDQGADPARLSRRSWLGFRGLGAESGRPGASWSSFCGLLGPPGASWALLGLLGRPGASCKMQHPPRQNLFFEGALWRRRRRKARRPGQPRKVPHGVGPVFVKKGPPGAWWHSSETHFTRATSGTVANSRRSRRGTESTETRATSGTLANARSCRRRLLRVAAALGLARKSWKPGQPRAH